MADQNTKAAIQYFDYQLLTKQSPGINDRYTDIINYMPVKLPYYNDSFKTNFTQSPNELPDSSYISLIKRLWFDRINIYNRNAWETNLVLDTSVNKRIFTDCVFLDWTRYMFAVYYDYSRMRIYKQIGVTENQSCGNDNLEDVSTWNFVNITKYWTHDYFPFSECLFDKFVITQFWKWKSKSSWVNWVVRNELMWDYLSIQTLFYDSVVGGVWATPWDYLCLYDGSLSTQINYIAANGISSIHSPIINNCLQMSSPFFWMYKVKVWEKTTSLSSSVVTDVVKNTSDTLSEDSSTQKRKVFWEYGDILSFVTADWIFMLNYSNVKPSESEFTYEWCTYFDTNFWANTAKYVISSLISHDNSMLYYDVKSWRIFWWLQWVSKFFFDIRNAYEFWQSYTDLVSISGVVLLIWWSIFSMIKPIQVGKWVVTFWWFVPLSTSVWYFSRDSFCIDDWVFYMINSRAKLFWRTFTSYYDVVTPAPKEIPIWYISDTTILAKWREDISLSVLAWDIYISISHNKIDNSQMKWNTKVLIYNSVCWLWYKWMISWVVIKWYKNNTWFGNNIYSFVGNKDYNSFTDSDQYFKTILKAQIWYESLNYTKTIAFTRTILWYNSYITKDKTIVKHNIDLWWWHRELMFWDLRRDDFVTNIMKLWKTWNTGSDFKNYPIWIAMIWGNWIWMVTPETRYLENEFNKFDSYTPVNDSYSNEKTDFMVSKMSTFQIDLNIPVDHITIEYITYGDNALEIAWVLAWYTIDNINHVRLSNNSTQQDSFDSWPSWEPLTPDSWNESEVA